MNHKPLLCLICLLLSLSSFGQESKTISGTVSDSESGELIFGARIYDTISQTATVSNEYGFYSLTIPKNDAVLRISGLGLPTQYFTISESETSVNLDVLSSTQKIDEVTIRGENKNNDSDLGVLDLPLSKVEKLPAFFGEKDALKILQLMPGVSSGVEGSNGIYVRGGGPDQNLILLDGIPVYNVSHLFGFFSVFNSDALSKVTLMKGGFPARYGGRVSSVLDIRMKEGNMKKYNLEGSIGLLSSRLLLEGPIKKGKTAFMISARRTYADALIRPFLPKGEKSGYYFYDLNAKVHHKINDKHHIYLSGYFGQDKGEFNESYNTGLSGVGNSRAQLNWGNAIATVRWNYRISSKLFLNTSFGFSNYQFGLGINDSGTDSLSSWNYGFDFISKITDWSGKADFTFIPNSKNYIRFGLGNTYHIFRPGVSQIKESNNDSEEQSNFGSETNFAHEIFAYFENDHKFTDWMKANYGVHFTSFLVGRKTYNEVQPRASLDFRIAKYSNVKLSYARTAQFLHLLTNTGIGLPTDLWVPATENTAPVTANQLSLGVHQQLGKLYNLRVEGYYKKMENLIQYEQGVTLINTGQSWEDKIAIGQGWSYGVELFFQKKIGKLTGWVGYTLSWSERQFDELNKGNVFPYTYDKRHDLSITASYEFNKKWDVGLVFVFGSGRAVSLPTQTYGTYSGPFGVGSEVITDLTAINNYRMPTYHRLDVSVNHTKQKRWGESIWSFSIYNVYNRQNAYFLFVGDDPSGKYDKTLKQVSLFPILPSVSWKFKLDFEKRKMNKHEKKKK